MSDPSKRLKSSDRNILEGWADIERPEPEQIIQDLPPLAPESWKEETTPVRLRRIRGDAQWVVDKISELTQKIDERCSHFKVSSPEGKGSPLFQAMVRVFDERTTTVTYDHYKRALEKREQLAREDSERLKLT